MKVFLVLHHEILGTPQDCRADEMVFYTCSSMKKAIDLIRKSGVVRWSWWEVQVHDLNSSEWPEHVGYYGRRGGKLARPPYNECVEIYRKERHT